MERNFPFITWTTQDFIELDSSKTRCYYVLSQNGHRTLAAYSHHAYEATDQTIFKTEFRFIANYGAHLGMQHERTWRTFEDMKPWLESLIHNSFIAISERGVPNNWHMVQLKGRDLVDWMPLPDGLKDLLGDNNRHTWILVKHGSKSWPIRVANNLFEEGWSDFRNAHEFREDTRLIFALETKWIFHVIAFDKDDVEILYPWSKAQNPYWLTLPMPLGDVRSSCTPSIIMSTIPIVRFGYYHQPMTNDKEAFERRLRPITKDLDMKEMYITMRSQKWIIPYINNEFDTQLFQLFKQKLELQWTDYILVTLLPNHELKVLVIDTYKKNELIYDWI